MGKGIKATDHYHEEPYNQATHSIISELSDKLAVDNFLVGWYEETLRTISELSPSMSPGETREYIRRSIKNGRVEAHKIFGGK